jgi:uncharacterized protein YhaN
LRNAKGAPIEVDVPFPGRSVHVHVWKVQVGRVPLYLLDTNLDRNSGEDRDITSHLYGGGPEMRIKQEIVDLENDRRAASLKFERAQLADELNRSVDSWLALKATAQTVEQMRSRVERSCQPEILKHASAHLDRLTLGKYHNIWTPLGQRHLVVDDEHGESLKVEHLSNGTREQVFLAIRLAVMKDFSERGVELPMVLDDVVVNFDQLRTEAAVRTLMEFAEQGQQILMFTCHLHLAHLFENHGVEPIWLPARAGAREAQRA